MTFFVKIPCKKEKLCIGSCLQISLFQMHSKMTVIYFRLAITMVYCFELFYHGFTNVMTFLMYLVLIYLNILCTGWMTESAKKYSGNEDSTNIV